MHPGLADIWVKGEYVFLESGDVIYNRAIYSDSDCISEVPPERYIYGFPYTAKYIDLFNNELTGSGIISNSMYFELYDSGGYNSLGSETGYYHISNGVLCFSYLFHFDPMGYSIEEGGNKDINYASCLVNDELR